MVLGGILERQLSSRAVATRLADDLRGMSIVVESGLYVLERSKDLGGRSFEQVAAQDALRVVASLASALRQKRESCSMLIPPKPMFASGDLCQR